MPELVKELIIQYGYVVLFFLLALGIVGIPVPDEIVMTFVGFLTSVCILNYYMAIAVSFFGAMTGMMISYFLGKKVGKPLLWKYGKWIRLTPKVLSRVEGWFNKYGLWTISFGYFIPGIRHFTCYLSGISGIPFRKYVLFASLGASIWCIVFITIGYYIGDTIDFERSLGPQLIGR